jgi:2-keto-4-pentenoate hydratase/2-oxohepta-3-ene-1,7-dioic acid hydratase in catechol pathway
MYIAVFDDYRVGLVEGDVLYDVTSAVPGASSTWPPIFINHLIAEWQTLAPLLVAARGKAIAVPVSSVKLLAPNPCPIHVIAAPANYKKHMNEMGDLGVTAKGKTAREQGFFLKSTASVIGAGQAVELPRGSKRRFDHESELAVIIGRTTKHATRENAMDSVFGYSCLIDITMRIDPNGRNEERVTRKSFDSFTPLGPWIVTADEVGDPGTLRNELFVNNERRQNAYTGDMLVDVPGLIELISSVMTLHPGDVIATGTPEGVGPIVPGDTVTIRIEQVGEMSVGIRETEMQPPHMF